jgi:RNA polymerase sigma-70 factor (ECF subfamily)
LNKNENLNIILKALNEGDSVVFDNLYSEYYQKLCTFLIGYTDDTAIIEDVVQDVFLKIWTNRKNLSIKTSLSGYLYKTAYTTLMEKYRQVKKKNNLLASYYYTAMIQAMESNQDEKNKRLKKLRKCIENLPERCRLVFYENKMMGLKYIEVAEKLNISIKTVEGHISRAMSILKDCMR